MMLGKSYAPTDKSRVCSYYTPNMFINTRKIALIQPDITCPITSENSTTTIITRRMPFCSIFCITPLMPSGATAYNILDPSRGGIGSILKTKKPRFTDTAVEVISPNIVGCTAPALLITPLSTPMPNAIKAITKLVIGPERATRAAPNRQNGLYLD